MSTAKGVRLLTEHTYRHPSTCPARCHTSQQLAGGFIRHAALSPLLFSVTFLQPSASICLPSASSCVSCSFGAISRSCFAFSPSVVFWLLHIGKFDNRDLEYIKIIIITIIIIMIIIITTTATIILIIRSCKKNNKNNNNKSRSFCSNLKVF